MQEFRIEKVDSYNRLLDYLRSYKGEKTWNGNRLVTTDYTFHISPKYIRYLKKEKAEAKTSTALIYGKDTTEKIVSIEVSNDKVYLFKNDGTEETRPYKSWIVTSKPLKNCITLDGNLPLKYMKFYDTQESYSQEKQNLYSQRIKMYTAYDQSESAMIYGGYTLFKGLKVNDVSVVSIDIEAEGLIGDDGKPISPNPEVYLISNTYRDIKGNITKKLFALDEYKSSYEMIRAWCEWIQTINPSIIVGHNIFGYDLPYLNFKYGKALPLGRNGQPCKIARKPSKFRKDGSQTYDFHNVRIFGRQVIDTFFLSIKYDFKRDYVSYALKQIMKQEGLEKEGRIVWDFTQNPTAKVWKNRDTDPETWGKFKEYCIDDGDDALSLYDLMIPSFFYYTQSIPKTFQAINNSATGTQINSFLIRGYLQESHSLPLPTDSEPYEGAISYGNPGIYRHVYKVDVASLYPSIMIQYKVYDRQKDPQGKFLEMVSYFTDERLRNKKLGKETKDRYYKDMEQAQKIVINSAYGMMGATGLNFNSPKNAAFVTEKGREILQIGTKWACGREFISIPKLNKNGTPKLNEEGKPKTEWILNPDSRVRSKGYSIVNVDTDSFSYTINSEMSPEQFKADIDELNSLYPDKIRWEDDGIYKSVIVIKAKNYVLDDGKKKKYKGSSITDQKKEPALREMLYELLDDISCGSENLVSIYEKYIKESQDIQDIKRWVTKKTISKAIFTSERENEKKVRDAIRGKTFSEGDKIWIFNDIDGLRQKMAKGEPQFYKKNGEPIMVDNTVLRLEEDWCGKYDKSHYLKRVHDTLKILTNIIDEAIFIDYTKKSSGKLLKQLVGENDG